MPDRDQMMDGLTSPYGEDMEQDYLPAMSYFSEGGEVDDEEDDDEEGRPLAIPMRPVYVESYGKGGAVKKAAQALENFLSSSRVKERLYHATPEDFSEFKPGGKNPNRSGPAIWMTPNKEFQPAAHNIRQVPDKPGYMYGSTSNMFSPGTNVMPLYANIKNPLVVTDQTWKEAFKGLEGDPWTMTQRTVDALKERGHDGVFYINKEGTLDEVVAFDPTQVKSAIGNRGTYDKTKPDIRKAKGGLVHRAEGSPVYGEIAIGGGITPDTKAGLRSTKGVDTFMTESARMLRNITGQGLSNLESTLRGSVAAIPGSVGDIESIFRESDKTRKFATTEEVLRDYMPKRVTTPTKEGRGFEEVGSYLPLPVPAGTVSKTAKGVKSGARKALQELGPTAAGMAESLAARTGAAPMNIVPEGPAAVRPLTMTDRTEQGKLFAGRLDDFIASVRNPVTKGQLLGSLKGKFRDYEVSRAAQALQDLDDAAKITPAELASRIEGIATPNRYKTTFVDPKEAGLHNAYDNVYGKAGHPVGSINLSYVPTEEAISAEEVGNKVRAAISNLAGAPFEKIKDIREFVSSGLANQPEKQTAFLKGVDDLGAQLEQTRTKHGLFEEMQNLMYLRFPEQKGYYTLWQTKLKEIPTTVNRRENPELYDSLVKKATDEANMEVKLQALGRIQKEYGPILDSDLRSYLEALPQSAKAGGNELLTSRIDDLRKTLYTDLKTDTNAILADNVALLDDIRREADRFSTYKGSHTAVNPEKNAMGFSRFTEHTVNVPGMGKLDGIYVSELQSDMFRDIKKLGKLGGSKQSDLKEMQSLVQGMKTRFAPIEGKLDENYGGTDAFLYLISGIKDDPKTLSQVLQSPAIGLSPTKADQFATDFVKDSKRIKKLEERTGVLTNEPKGTYLIEEPIANIETQPQVVQQLLAKNAIAGAIQRGKSFVAFPGVESKQAKLYEKLPNNLRQVIKDLGEGFVTQPIIIKGKDGVERQHLAVIWDNNAAQRIMNQGVPFKKGGLVDKKAIEQKYAGGGIVKKAAQALTKMGAKESQVAGKELTTLQDTYTSLGDRINERVAKAQQQMDAMEFKYKPGQRVFTEDSAKKNKPPYTIKSKRLSGDMIVRDPKTLKAVRDPETGKAKRTPYEPGYLIREERGPDDWAEYVLPESAIKGSIDEFSKGGRVSKKLPGKRKYI